MVVEQKDLQICYDILQDAIYQDDKLIFELKLNQISDKKLKLGLIFEIYLKHTSYKADKKVLQEISYIMVDDPIDINKIDEYQKYFIDNMKPFMGEKRKSRPSMDSLNECLELLDIVGKFPNSDWSQTKEISERIKVMSPDSIKHLKELLIQLEHFDEVVQLDKVINNNK